MSNTPVTFVNVFDVDPANHAELVELLGEALERAIRHRRGFIAARLLVSADGRRVINEADWISTEAVEAIQTDPEVRQYAGRAANLATASPAVYSVHTRLEA